MPTTPGRIRELANDWALRRNVVDCELILAAAARAGIAEHGTIGELEAIQAMTACDEQEIEDLFMEVSEFLSAERQPHHSKKIRRLAKRIAKSYRLKVYRYDEVIVLAKRLLRTEEFSRAKESGESVVHEPFEELPPGEVERYLSMAAKVLFAFFSDDGVNSRTKLQEKIVTLLDKIKRSESLDD